MPYKVTLSYQSVIDGAYDGQSASHRLFAGAFSYFANRGATVVVGSMRVHGIKFDRDDPLQNIVDLLWLAKKEGYDYIDLSIDNEDCLKVILEREKHIESGIYFARVKLDTDDRYNYVLRADLRPEEEHKGIGVPSSSHEDDLDVDIGEILDELMAEGVHDSNTNNENPGDNHSLIPTEIKIRGEELNRLFKTTDRKK